MGKKRLNPSGAILVGIGFIGFGLLYYFTGILPSRNRGWFFSRNDAVTATEDPVRFGIGIFVLLAAGVVLLIWGVSKSGKD